VGEGVTSVKVGDHVVALYTCVDAFTIPDMNAESDGALIVRSVGNASSASLAR